MVQNLTLQYNKSKYEQGLVLSILTVSVDDCRGVGAVRMSQVTHTNAPSYTTSGEMREDKNHIKDRLEVYRRLRKKEPDRSKT